MLEGTARRPLKIIGRNLTNHLGVAVSEFDANGELLKIYPSKHEAARKMGINYTSLCLILSNRMKNNSGKIFANTTPLDECLIEIRERNKRPYQ